MKRVLFMCFFFFKILYSQIIWGPDRVILPDPIFNSGFQLRAAVWGDTIHLVWYEPGLYFTDEVYYIRSIDKGETWSEPFNLSAEDPEDAIEPWITCFGNKIHVVYVSDISGDSVMYIRSLDGGNTWEAPRRIIKNARSPKIVCRHDTLFVVVNGTPAVPTTRLIKSFDGGNIWTTPQVINFPIGIEDIEINSSYLHVCGVINEEVYYLRSPDLGNTWEDPVAISPIDSTFSILPKISVFDSSVYISWSDYIIFPIFHHIFERHSHDNGVTFSNSPNLITPVPRAWRSEIYTNGEFTIIVWNDNRVSGGVDYDLFWRASFDGGETWTDEDTVTHPRVSRVGEFCLTGQGNDVYLFWDDGGKWEGLHFRKAKYINIGEKEYAFKGIKILSSNILILPQKIEFFVKEGERYSLNLFSIDGRKLRALKQGIGKGKEETIWEGISSGEHFLILNMGEEILKRKILILKRR